MYNKCIRHLISDTLKYVDLLFSKDWREVKWRFYRKYAWTFFDPKDPKAALQYKNTEVRGSLFIIESYVKENENQNVSRSFWTSGWIIV